MLYRRHSILGVLAILWVSSSPIFGENFIAPAEGPVAFRRDRIPLDADSMVSLSRQLLNLAEGQDGKTAASRRRAAQMLALSIALDPSNNRARGLANRLKRNQFSENADSNQLQAAREKIRNKIAWLKKPDAGESANALAACLTDVLVTFVSENDEGGDLLASGERGAWKSWVPDLSAYEVEVLAKVDDPPESLPPTETANESKILLQEAKVFTPLWKRVGPVEKNEWVLSSGPLEMSATILTEPAPFSIQIVPGDKLSNLGALSVTLVKLLRNTRPSEELPKGGQITIHGQALAHSSQSGMRLSIGAAAAVLASAALSGTPPEATIIGVVDENGKFELPPSGFWDQLQSLTSGENRQGRLILPTAAADYLPSLLAFEKAQFFLDYEVILAADFNELLALSAKAPDERLANISAKFGEIRSKSSPQTLGQYLVNPFVSRRLIELAQQAPNHYSAKLLALQGAGKRPIFLTRKILGLEIKRAIKPVEWMFKHNLLDLDYEEIQKLGLSYEKSRTAMNSLQRYTERQDRDIMDKAFEFLARIRSMNRAIEKSQDFYSRQTAHSEVISVTETYKSLSAAIGESVEAIQAPDPE